MMQFRPGPKGSMHFNIMFGKTYPKRHGKFPPDHPCADDPKPTVSGKCRTKEPGPDSEWIDVPGEQPVSDTALGRFRARGYWASCFPEGDGITAEALNGQDADKIMCDISECFSSEDLYEEMRSVC